MCLLFAFFSSFCWEMNPNILLLSFLLGTIHSSVTSHDAEGELDHLQDLGQFQLREATKLRRTANSIAQLQLVANLAPISCQLDSELLLAQLALAVNRASSSCQIDSEKLLAWLLLVVSLDPRSYSLGSDQLLAQLLLAVSLASIICKLISQKLFTRF